MKRRLRNDACPSVFSWSKQIVQGLSSKSDVDWNKKGARTTRKDWDCFRRRRIFGNNGRKEYVSRGIQVEVQTDVPCLHRLSLSTLMKSADTPAKQTEYISHYTGFKSYERFMQVLESVLPDLDQGNIVYCDTVTANNDCKIDTSVLFDTDSESQSTEDSPVFTTKSDGENDSQNLESRSRKLPVVDEFLLVPVTKAFHHNNVFFPTLCHGKHRVYNFLRRIYSPFPQQSSYRSPSDGY